MSDDEELPTSNRVLAVLCTPRLATPIGIRVFKKVATSYPPIELMGDAIDYHCSGSTRQDRNTVFHGQIGTTFLAQNTRYENSRRWQNSPHDDHDLLCLFHLNMRLHAWDYIGDAVLVFLTIVMIPLTYKFVPVRNVLRDDS